MVGCVPHTARTVAQLAVEQPSMELWARVPVRGISVEAHEQLQVTERPEAEFVERLDRRRVACDWFDVYIGRTASP
jgi:hypothetical protein